ncbi:S8 family serine peptidase [Bifidobacterium leontopitheci]|uniref:Subtilisin family peptidase n=1 Tax=Bifidobacterium leontopitheci TaxID=2650774 RepID=A0A6I1GE63_9BIFI|nr:S8 family serine peptidase [Bifidobacterium leontopitheci]KAB7789825.1 subtilisin family peptidase [Bifidobacterium leontopitheci]
MAHKRWSRLLAAIASVAMAGMMQMPAATAAGTDTTAEPQQTVTAGNDAFTSKKPLEKSQPTVRSGKGGDATVVFDAAGDGDNKLALSQTSIERYLFWTGGLTATGSGFTAGEQVNLTDVAPSGAKQAFAPATADANGSISAKLYAINSFSELGIHTILAKGAKSGVTADATLTVTADSSNTVKVTLSTTTLTQDQFIDQPISIKATGLEKNGRVALHIASPDGTTQTVEDSGAHLRADANGEFRDTLTGNTVNIATGKWSVSVLSLSSAGSSMPQGAATYTVTPGAERHETGKITIPGGPSDATQTMKITESQFVKNGLPYTATGIKAFDAVDVNLVTPLQKDNYLGAGRADGDGTFSNAIVPNGEGGATFPHGTYTLTLRSRTTGDYAQLKFIVTDENGDYPENASLDVTPTKLTADDLGPNGKGITVTVKNATGANISLLDSTGSVNRMVVSYSTEGSFYQRTTAQQDGTNTAQVKLVANPSDGYFTLKAQIDNGGALTQTITVGDPKTTETPAGDKQQPTQGGTVSGDLVHMSGDVSAFIESKGVGGLAQQRSSTYELKRSRLSNRQKKAETLKDVNAQAKETNSTTDELFAQLKKLDPKASKLYEAAFSVPGIAVRADAKALRELAQQSNQVVTVSPLVQRTATTATGSSAATAGKKTAAATEPANANNDTLVQAIKTWKQTGKTGKGINIAIIDTGLDYTHADFGGAGTTDAYATALASKADPLTDPTLKTLVNQHGVKYKGGYDFAGTSYNANTQASDDVYDPFPAPDANPIDGKGGRHGTHVAGTALGYGVNADGSTFTGDYGKQTEETVQQMKIGPGAAPEAGIYALKVFGDGGGSTEVTGAALEWVAQQVAQNKADIDLISMSLGTSFTSNNDPDITKVNELAKSGILSVAAAGNDGDYTDASGSPANASSALAVAATQSGGSLQDAIAVTAPSDLVSDKYAGQYSQNIAVVNPTFEVADKKVVKLTDQSNLNGCNAYSAADAAAVKGNVVYVEWDDSNVACGSATRFDKAYDAGAVGIIFASQSDIPESGIAGNYYLPGFQMNKTTAEKLMPAINAGTLKVTLSSKLATSVKNTYDSNKDVVASFTSRGIHGSYDGTVKPDVAAPGVGVVSAGSGTGTGMAVMSGTSMATPLTSGVAALVLQSHPQWKAGDATRATLLKTQLMNTADHDIYTADRKTAYGPLRIGTGRIDAYAAVNNDVRVAVSDNPEAVTASFGIVQVGEKGYEATKQFTVTNDSDADHTYKVSYEARTETDGVTYKLSADTVSVKAHGTATFSVTLSIPDAEALRHTIDPTMTAEVGGVARSYVTDATGVIRLVPTEQSDDATPIRVAVVAAPKPISETKTNVTFDSATATEGKLAVTGHGVDQGTGSTAYVSRLAAMQLGAEDPVDVYSNPDSARSLASADIRAVGAASTAPQLADPSKGMLGFGFVMQQSWSRIGMTLYPEVYVDVSGDGRSDFLVTTTVSPAGSQSDTVYAVTYDLASNAAVDVEPIDDASISDSNTIVLPVKLAALGYTKTTTQTKIRYQATVESVYASHPSDGSSYATSYIADTADPATYDVYNPDLWFGDAAGDADSADLLTADKDGVTLTAHRANSETAAKAKPLILHLRGAMPDAAGTSATPDIPAVDNGETPAPKVDKTKLAAAIAKAKTLKASDYTKPSWQALQGALTSAEKVNADADATQQQVNDALAALQRALDSLRKVGPGETDGNGGQHGTDGSVNGGVAPGANAAGPQSGIGRTGASVTAVVTVMLAAGCAATVLLRRKSAAAGRHGR